MIRMSVWGLAASGAVMATFLVLGGGTAVIAQSPPDQPEGVQSPASPTGGLLSDEHQPGHITLALSQTKTTEATRGPADVSMGQTNQSADVFDVRGRVVGPEGEPVRGAKLYLIHGMPPAPKVRAVADAEGKFEFTMTESEFGLVRTDAPWFSSIILAVAEGYGVDFGRACDFEVSGDLAARIPFTTYRQARERKRTLTLVRDDVPLVGRIVDPEGRPVAGATVRVTGIWASQNEDLTPWLTAVGKGEDFDVTRPLMEKRIGGPTFRQIMPMATTGEDGRFRLTGGIGRERIAHLLIEGPGITSEMIYARTRPGPLFRVPHVLESPQGGTFRYYGATFEHVGRRSIPIVGTVLDSDTGEPVADVRIQARPGNVPAGEKDRAVDVEFAQGTVDVITDPQGRYRLTGVPVAKGSRVLAVPLSQPYLPSRKVAKFSEGQESLRIDFELKRGIRIRGRITDARTGRPVKAQVTYFVFTDNPHSRSAPFLRGASIVAWQDPYQTDQDGKYANVGLPGRGLLAVLAMDSRRYPRAAGPDETKARETDWPSVLLRTDPELCVPWNFHYVAEIDLAEDAKAFEHDIVLDPGQTLEGTVLDPAGQPLSGGVFCGLTDHDSPYYKMKSATFRVNFYRPDEPRTIFVVHKERKLAGGQVLEGPQQGPLTVQLEPWGAITGRVVDAEGKPRPNLLIPGYAPGGHKPPGYGTLPERHYQTDEHGRFHIDGLVPGMKYDVDVIEGRRLSGSIVLGLSVKPGETKDVGDVTIQPLRRLDRP